MQNAHKKSLFFGRQGRGRRGAAAVEFAIVAPVFVLLIFGMIEYGRMIMVQQIITNAAREGSRRVVLETAEVLEIETSVREYLESCSIKATGSSKSDVTVQIQNQDGTVIRNDKDLPPPGEPVSVVVSFQYTHASWLPVPRFLGEREMFAMATMRRE